MMQKTKKTTLAPAVGLATGLMIGTSPAYAQEFCKVGDNLSYELRSDCYAITWQLTVWYSYQHGGGTFGVGEYSGRNDCDPGGLNCDGSTRLFKQYEATKQLYQTWGYEPDVVQFW